MTTPSPTPPTLMGLTTTCCAFCLNPASVIHSRQIDLVSIKFLYHYFQIPYKPQVSSDGNIFTPTFPTCEECSYLFNEIRRLASIWVEVQVHLFDSVVPEIIRRFQVKDIQQGLNSTGTVIGDKNKELRSKDSLVVVQLKEEFMKLIGSIPDAVDAKRQGERIGRLLPVQVSKLSESVVTNHNNLKGIGVSLPEIQIESEDWNIRHSNCGEGNVHVVTIVYSHDSGSSSTMLLNSSSTSNEKFDHEPQLIPEDEEEKNENEECFSSGTDDSDELLTPLAKKSKGGSNNNKSSIGEHSDVGETKRPGRCQKVGEHDESMKDRPKIKRKSKTRTNTKVLTEPRRQIQCKFCPLIVFYPHTYRKHEQRIHKNLLNHKCSKCKEIFSSERFLLAHAEIHRSNVKEWKCTICNKSYSRSNNLRKHIQTVHIPDFIEGSFVVKNNHAIATIDDLKCPVCFSQYTSRKKFTKHMNLHYKQVHRCDYCTDEVFKTKESQQMIAHLYKFHPDLPRNLACPNCEKLFSYKFVLYQHIDYHKLEDLKPLSCMYCEMRFSTDEESALNKHQITCIEISSESDPKPLEEKCPVCDKLFPRGRDVLLARHELSHSELVVHNCTQTECGRKFTRKSFLDAHVVTHSAGPFQCTICPSIFKTSNDLNQHLGETHIGESTIKCKAPGCNEVFAHRSSMLYHKSRCHDGPKFMCQICKKSFNKREGMKIHMERLHPSDCPIPPRQFECHICSKFFVRQTILNQHIRVAHEKKKMRSKTCTICKKQVSCRIFTEHLNYHNGIKSHLCSLCGKSFTWSNNYRHHLQMHAGVKNHQCEDCGKKFLQLRHLKCHSQTQHPKDQDGNLLPKPPRKNQAKVQKKSTKTAKEAKLHKTKDEEETDIEEGELVSEQETGSEHDEDNEDDTDDQALSKLSLTHATRTSPRTFPVRTKIVSSLSLGSLSTQIKPLKPKIVTGNDLDNEPDSQPRLGLVESIHSTRRRVDSFDTTIAQSEFPLQDGTKTITASPTRKSNRNRKSTIRN